MNPSSLLSFSLSNLSLRPLDVNSHTHATQYPISKITVKFSDLGYQDTTRARVRDLYARTDLGVFTGSFTGDVDIHAGLALRVCVHRLIIVICFTLLCFLDCWLL
jgi:hypothetical protein